MSGDTTEQACATAGSDDNPKQLGESEVAADKEVDTLMSLPGAVGKVADQFPMPCALPPSPPMDANQVEDSTLVPVVPPKSVSEVDDTLQGSSCDDSAGYASCSSSVLATTDETPDDLQSTVDVSSGGFFSRAKHLSAASKYRLRCQCGAKNCRQYLY